MLSQIESLTNQRIIGLYNAIILCKSWQGGHCLAVWKTINAYLVSSFWAFGIASLQPILLTVAIENIFLLLSLSLSCPHQNAMWPQPVLSLVGPRLDRPYPICYKMY